MFERSLFDDEHEIFREAFRKFIQAEILPHQDVWEDQQMVSREVWQKAGQQGFLCPTLPEEHGGAGVDRLFSLIMIEEMARLNASGPGFSLHSDIVAPYIAKYGTEAQKKRYLPQMAKGEMIGAIAMTEPGTGSDLQSIEAKARVDGDELVLNGTKMFISNGYMSDLVIVVAKIIDPKQEEEPRLSLLLVEAGTEGFSKEKPLKKMGQKAQDTCVLNFSDVRLPRSAILGGDAAIGKGIGMLFGELAWERLIIAIGAVAGAEFCFNEALNYTRERKAFGRPLASFQDVRFKLAEMKTKIAVGRSYVDRCMGLVLENRLPADEAAMAKLWCSEMGFEVADMAVQMHGGYGYMNEYPVSRAFTGMRVHRIYGGANEIMKELIARNF